VQSEAGHIPGGIWSAASVAGHLNELTLNDGIESDKKDVWRSELATREFIICQWSFVIFN
jgi:hypothetical protein